MWSGFPTSGGQRVQESFQRTEEGCRTRTKVGGGRHEKVPAGSNEFVLAGPVVFQGARPVEVVAVVLDGDAFRDEGMVDAAEEAVAIGDLVLADRRGEAGLEDAPSQTHF